MAGKKYELTDDERARWQGYGHVYHNAYDEAHPRDRRRQYVSAQAVAALASQPGTVLVTCYRSDEVWASREDAMRFYMAATFNSEGAERDRYVRILEDLMSGCHTASDEGVY